MVVVLRIILFFVLSHEDYGLWFGCNIMEVIYTISTQILYGSVIFVNIYFIYCAINDLQRKKFFMMQLSFMLAPKKNQKYEGWKVLPSLKMSCPVSMKSWCSIRKLLIDYGKSYYLRNNMNLSIIFLLYLLVGIYTTLGFLGILGKTMN